MSSRAPERFAGWRRWWIVRFLRSRVFDPTVAVLRNGAEPKQLALSIAVGVTSGVCPLFGLTAVLCGFLAFLLRRHCHPPTMMLVNFAATPLEISLLIPFMRVGEFVTGSPRLSVSPTALLEALRGAAPKQLLIGLSHAVLGWALATLPTACVLYYTTLPLVQRVATRRSPLPPHHHSTPKSPRLPTRMPSPRRPMLLDSKKDTADATQAQ